MTTVIDLLILAEWSWCTLLLLGRRLERTLILACGVMTAGYTAHSVTPWLTNMLFPPSSAVFEWTLTEVQGNTVPVSVISEYVPPEAASTTGGHAHWIASHILLSLMFVAITLAIFATFIVIVMLREALWDRPSTPRTAMRKWTTRLVAGAASAYTAVVTAVLLGNLSWLHSFIWLRTQTENSVLMQWIGNFVSHVL